MDGSPVWKTVLDRGIRRVSVKLPREPVKDVEAIKLMAAWSKAGCDASGVGIELLMGNAAYAMPSKPVSVTGGWNVLARNSLPRLSASLI